MPKIAELTGDEDIKRTEISRFLGDFDRKCMRFEKASLASARVCLRGITIDASIWTKESVVSCRVCLYKLCQLGEELWKYFHQDIHMTKGNGFVKADDWGEFMQNFSQDTEMAVMDYREIQIVKEEILDLQCGGATSDNRRIKWDILINGGDGEIIYHDEKDFHLMLYTCSVITSTGMLNHGFIMEA